MAVVPRGLLARAIRAVSSGTTTTDRGRTDTGHPRKTGLHRTIQSVPNPQQPCPWNLKIPDRVAHWVIDLDIQKFFDSVRWDLIVKAVEAHTDAIWVKLYVEPWLRAPLQLPDGAWQMRDRGTPQGSAVSPVLANLFMHYAFDMWLSRSFRGIQFERYADDGVVHCVTEHQAHEVLAALGNRMEEVGLRLHPDKTKIVYCKDRSRRGSYEHVAFTFLGFTFQPRKARDRNGKQFLSFLPAVSKDALKRLGAEVRSWRLHQRVSLTEQELAKSSRDPVRSDSSGGISARTSISRSPAAVPSPPAPAPRSGRPPRSSCRARRPRRSRLVSPTRAEPRGAHPAGRRCA
ncbi:reverse transcriptase domain-containing protein [Streptomyces parvus]|uniref:reverse transcriptase domain-containing protein n=1 Tax=Streptomyces parvus TaxID=66428 RepID=UPI0037098CC9